MTNTPLKTFFIHYQLSIVHYSSEPSRIFHIVLRDPVDLSADELLADVFYFFGRNAGVNTARLHFRAFQNHGARCNDRIAANLCIVHYNSAHAYQHIVIDRTTMYEGVMPNRHIVADNGLRAFIGTMNNGAILDIHFITYTNAVYIAPNTALNQTLQSSPITTSPTMVALGAIKTLLPNFG